MTSLNMSNVPVRLAAAPFPLRCHAVERKAEQAAAVDAPISPVLRTVKLWQRTTAQRRSTNSTGSTTVTATVR